jgi:hypothetical protein
MQKILKTVEVRNKIREKELLKMDEESDEEQAVVKKTKVLKNTDKFFTLEDEDDEEGEEKVEKVEEVKPVAKKIVQRNGMIAGEFPVSS